MNFPFEATPVCATASGPDLEGVSRWRASDGHDGKAPVRAQEAFRHRAKFLGLRTTTTPPSPIKQREDS